MCVSKGGLLVQRDRASMYDTMRSQIRSFAAYKRVHHDMSNHFIISCYLGLGVSKSKSVPACKERVTQPVRAILSGFPVLSAWVRPGTACHACGPLSGLALEVLALLSVPRAHHLDSHQYRHKFPRSLEGELEWVGNMYSGVKIVDRATLMKGCAEAQLYAEKTARMAVIGILAAHASGHASLPITLSCRWCGQDPATRYTLTILLGAEALGPTGWRAGWCEIAPVIIFCNRKVRVVDDLLLPT